MLEVSFESPIEFSAIITATISLFATFVLARYTLFAKRDFQRKEALNRVLYGLLECRWAAHRATQLQALDLSTLFAERLELKLPGFKQEVENQQEQWEAMFACVSDKIAEGVVTVDYKSMYSTSIEELSKVEPLLAYEISSRANWDKTFELMESYVSDVVEAANLESDDHMILSQALDKKLDDTKVEMLNTLSNDILKVLKLCSFTTWLKTKAVGLKQPQMSLEEDMTTLIDKVIEEDILPLLGNMMAMKKQAAVDIAS